MLFSKKLTDRGSQEFSEQYRKYSSLIFSVVYTKINNFHEAEEICQEVFIRFFKQFDQVKNPRKWLYGTLRIVVIDYYKEKNNSNIDIEAFSNDISLSFENGFRDTRMIIEDALENFSDKNDTERIVFELVAIYNFTYEQAGKHLNLTYKQVRSRYGKALNNLVDYLKSKGIKNLEDLL